MVFFTSSAIAVFALILFVLSLSFVLPREAGVSVAKSVKAEATGEPVLSLLRKTGVIPIFFCIVACGFLRDGIESWLPTLYSEAFNRAAEESILVSVILPVFSIVSVTLIKVLHKNRFFNNEASGSAILFCVAVVICVPLAFFISIDAVWARFVSLVLTALVCAAMHGVNFLLISGIPGRFARYGRASTVSGLTNAFIYVGAAIATYGIALISDSLGWTVTIIFWIAVATFGAAMIIPAYKKYTKFVNENNE
jgi:OPA family glycerol-3-phosphate transporter-like MFS transporter